MNLKTNPIDTIILRLSGEIPIKSDPVRGKWEKIIVERVSKRLDEDEILWREKGRIYIATKRPFRLLKKLKKIFGIATLSPAAKCEASIEAIKKKALEVALYYIRKLAEKGRRVKSFAIVTKKVLAKDFGSTEVRYDVGAHIKKNLNLSVNLDYPDLPIHIDVRRDYAYIYVEILKAPGGLPIGVQERALVQWNGDKESIVATWLMLKRGCPIILVYFDLCLSSELRKKIIESAKIMLKEWAEGTGELWITPFHEIYKGVKNSISEEYRWISLRWLMLQASVVIAKKTHSQCIVLGDKPKNGEKIMRVSNILWTSNPMLHFPSALLSHNEVENLYNFINNDELKIPIIRPESICEELKMVKSKSIIPSLDEFLVVKKKLVSLEKILDSIVERSEILRF